MDYPQLAGADRHGTDLSGAGESPRRITQDVRDYAATLNDKEQGMVQMSEKFRQMGSEVDVAGRRGEGE